MPKSDVDGEIFFDTLENNRNSVDSISSFFSVDEYFETNLRILDPRFWTSDMMSVSERRKQFAHLMGFEEFVSCDKKESLCDNLTEHIEIERNSENCCATLNDMGVGDSLCCIRDKDRGKKLTLIREGDFAKFVTLKDFEKFIGLSCYDGFGDKYFCKNQCKSWWRKLISWRNIEGLCRKEVFIKNCQVPRNLTTKVLQHRKSCRELTDLFMGQEIKAHKGLIRTMKFSPLGSYIATGGEDCVVRIWQVKELEVFCKCFVAEGFCKVFGEVDCSESLSPRNGEDSTPIVIPKKSFRIMETPFQEFYGHTSDILDLSWSNSNYVITSSMDKTVRMWKVGFAGCLKVFQHNDYVTCIQFNPIDEKYFISGSIDGKVRIWSVFENQVVDWADIRDIVTSLCYKPDGKGFVVGSINGNCRFYDYGNSIKLDTQLCIDGRKKSIGKRITALEFSPEDPKKLMITSADSRVRICDGLGFVHNFKGLRKTKSHISASFTSDGKHIVSVGEDSNVYIWNYDFLSKKSPKKSKSIRSFELFFSEGVSVAIPWPKVEHKTGSYTNEFQLHSPQQKVLDPSILFWDSECLQLRSWLFSDCVSRVGPEETLFKLPQNLTLKNEKLSHYTQLSLVIVTASYDGCIRSFLNYGLPLFL